MHYTTEYQHRPFQFRLRTLLVGMLLVSLGLGWFAARRQVAQRQRAAVAGIVGLGGVVHFDYEFAAHGGFDRWSRPNEPTWLRNLLSEDFFHRAVSVSFCNQRELTDDDLGFLEDLPQLKGLSIDRGRISDEGLGHLAGLTSLERLTLAHVGITDAGLERLEGLRHLRSLNLFGTAVTGAGLESLQGLPRLQQLNLAYTQLRDEELANLRACRQLQEVRLRGANITDAGLGYLDGLSELRRLDLTATKVSNAGVQDLRSALPHVRISR